jgi:hypothetical protein
LAGREKELKDTATTFVWRDARRDRSTLCWLARDPGKTSLLNRIETEAEELHYVTSRTDLNEGDADPFGPFYKIYGAVLVAAVCRGAFTGVSGQAFSEYREPWTRES